ncbi:MAG: molybdenum cofactor guanylyltransferase [Pseudomonadota bacterium]
MTSSRPGREKPKLSATPRTAVLPDGLVLSGGAGRRVDGRDKGLLQGEHGVAAKEALDLLRRYCGRVFLSANRNLERYESMGSDGVLRDSRPGHQGPLAGLETVRPVLSSDRLLLLPCDTSGISHDLPGRLLYALDADPDCDVIHAHAADRDQYLVAAIRRRALCSVSSVLDQQGGAVRAWLRTLTSRRLYLDSEEGAALRNRNDSADWYG